MKIIYNQNPLATVVELDDAECVNFWHLVKIRELESIIGSAHFYLEEGKRHYDERRAWKELDKDYHYTDDKSDLDKRVDNLRDHYLCELRNMHVGDCTCFPCSCEKCHAESLLGIDTIEGLGKHPGARIGMAFRDAPNRTCREAIDYLEEHTPEIKDDWHTDHIDRWITEHGAALAWLQNYKKTKLDK